MADSLRQILLERAKAGGRAFVLYDAFGTVEFPPNIATPSAPEGLWSSHFVRAT